MPLNSNEYISQLYARGTPASDSHARRRTECKIIIIFRVTHSVVYSWSYDCNDSFSYISIYRLFSKAASWKKASSTRSKTSIMPKGICKQEMNRADKNDSIFGLATWSNPLLRNVNDEELCNTPPTWASSLFFPFQILTATFFRHLH